jgi:hypothetical protein
VPFVKLVLRAFLDRVVETPALQAFAARNALTIHYVLRAPEAEF